MEDWFYVWDGKQQGPVRLETLRALAQDGTIQAETMVWNASMPDWTPAAEIDGIFSRSIGETAPPPSADLTASEPAPKKDSKPEEIAPGSEPIGIIACVMRGFELTKRNFGGLFLVGMVYVFVLIGVSIVMTVVDQVTGMAGEPQVVEFLGQKLQSKQPQPSLLHQIVLNLLSFFLAIGATRITLNVVDGKPFHPNLLFGGGPLFIRAFLAALIFALAAAVCMLPLQWVIRTFPFHPEVVPPPKALMWLFTTLILGAVAIIYLSLRFGFYLFAIVDRGLGPIEALKYSSQITRGQRLPLLLLSLVMALILIAGLLCFVIGVIFSIPVATLAWVLAYRWMQYGSQVARDRTH